MNRFTTPRLTNEKGVFLNGCNVAVGEYNGERYLCVADILEPYNMSKNGFRKYFKIGFIKKFRTKYAKNAVCYVCEKDVANGACFLNCAHFGSLIASVNTLSIAPPPVSVSKPTIPKDDIHKFHMKFPRPAVVSATLNDRETEIYNTLNIEMLKKEKERLTLLLEIKEMKRRLTEN